MPSSSNAVHTETALLEDSFMCSRRPETFAAAKLGERMKSFLPLCPRSYTAPSTGLSRSNVRDNGPEEGASDARRLGLGE